MTNKEILELWNSPNINIIWCFRNGVPFFETETEWIINEPTLLLKTYFTLSASESRIYYSVGNQFLFSLDFSDYGKTWIFQTKPVINEN